MTKRSNKKKRTPFLYKMCSLILIFVSLFLIGSIIYLNILNFFLLVLVVGFIIIITAFCVLLMLRSRKKKTGFVCSLFLVLIFGLFSFYINKTTGLLSNLNLNYKTYNYSVIVLKDSPYKNLKDINGKKLGYFDDGSTESEKALNKVLGKIELEPNKYEDTHALANALLEENEDAVLIEDSYLDILSEGMENGDINFKNKIRKIYSFVIVTKTNDISKDINVTKEPFNIYVSGIDTYGEISSVSRSDVNMVVSVNPATRQILLTSIPRDYYVQLHGKSGYRDKLTHAGLYGTDMSIQTIEDLLDIEINYYVKVNFSSVIKVVDAIGGVKVYSDYSFTSIDNYRYTKGYNEVGGEEALSFARERKAFATGDRQRVKNQQALLRAIFAKCTSKSIITTYSKLLDSMSGSFVTNMKMSRLTALIKMQISKNYSWNIVTNSLEGTDASNYTYSAPSQKAYVMEPVEKSVLYATELINKVIDGKILDEETMEEVSNNVNKVTKGNSNSNSTTSNGTTSTGAESSSSSQSSSVSSGLQAKLVKNSVTFVEGDDYIYHGYTAAYDGKDITHDSSLVEKFSVKGKVFDDYQELVLYVSKLDSGSYTIIYTLQYKGESVILNQSVTIEPLSQSNSSDDKKDDDSIIDIEDIPSEDSKPNSNDYNDDSLNE